MDTTREWHRLDAIATKYEPKMRQAFTKAFVIDSAGAILPTLRALFVETCRETADEHGLVFNPTTGIYYETINSILDGYTELLDVRAVRAEVSRIIPTNVTGSERDARLVLSDGLDAPTAIRLEKERQNRVGDPTGLKALERDRRGALLTRRNILALTETNRAVNAALVAVWRAQEMVSKAIFGASYSHAVVDVENPGASARKIIITRRDERVCHYCDPLDGIEARLTEDFVTEYGVFPHPPFHPRCRCFIFVEA